MQDLNIALFQYDISWENPIANREKIQVFIEGLAPETDLLVLPEMFTTGFSMKPQGLAETMDGATVVWMQEMAIKHQLAITGSLIITEKEEYYNRLVFVYDNGEIESYDKRHAFTLAGEQKEYTRGTERLIVSYKGWKICPLICYDLRFPVWARNKEEYDVLLYVANWPAVRIKAWDALLKARAIENMTYTVAVNRVGVDANGHKYCGNSIVLDSLGEVLDAPASNKEMGCSVTLSKENLDKNRNRFGFLKDGDDFVIIPSASGISPKGSIE
ncbi:MAG: amidohydrolase [Flavobacteriaceae bacterium]|nr:amidohydrolase [Flavobacteriaceae bacterium]